MNLTDLRILCPLRHNKSINMIYCNGRRCKWRHCKPFQTYQMEFGMGSDPMDNESLAQLLHEAGREAVLTGKVVKKIPNEKLRS